MERCDVHDSAACGVAVAGSTAALRLCNLHGAEEAIRVDKAAVHGRVTLTRCVATGSDSCCTVRDSVLPMLRCTVSAPSVACAARSRATVFVSDTHLRGEATCVRDKRGVLVVEGGSLANVLHGSAASQQSLRSTAR